MVSFDSYIQPASGPPPPPVVDAPIIIDALSASALRPFMVMVQSLEQNSNVEVAAAEGKRLGPYFNMLSRYLSQAIESGAEARSQPRAGRLKDLTTPENLAGMFNAAAKKTKNTLTTDVAVLPANIISEGPASFLFKNERQFDAPYRYGARNFNFGFLQVFEGGKYAAKSSTTFPTFLLDNEMMDAAAPYGISDTLKHFQAAMTHINHDMLHHFTSPIVNTAIAHKFPDTMDNIWMSPMGDWYHSLEEKSLKQRDVYEAWMKISHMRVLTSGTGAETDEFMDRISQYFDELKRIGQEIAVTGGDNETALKRAHEVVDYFGTVMAHALTRAYPLNHPLVAHCFACQEAADPAPQMLLPECVGMLTDAMPAQANAPDAVRKLRFSVLASAKKHLVAGYKETGLDILPDDGAPGYAALKMLQLMHVSREDVDAQAPFAVASDIKYLQEAAGEKALQMFEAAAKVFQFPLAEPEAHVQIPVRAKPASAGAPGLNLKDLPHKMFNRASDPDGRTVFAVSSCDAEPLELPARFELVGLAEVLTLLAQPGFADSNLDALVTETTKEQLVDLARESPWRQKSVELLVGSSDTGFSLHTVTAKGPEGPLPLYIIEDRSLGKCLVAGAAAIPEVFKSKLNDAGLTYIDRRSSDAGRNINAFIEESTAIEGRSKWSSAVGLILAFGTLQNIPAQFLGPRNNLQRGTMPGEVIVEARGMPAVYTSVVRLKR